MNVISTTMISLLGNDISTNKEKGIPFLALTDFDHRKLIDKLHSIGLIEDIVLDCGGQFILKEKDGDIDGYQYDYCENGVIWTTFLI